MFGNIQGFLAFAQVMGATMRVNNEEWKERIFKKFGESKSYPRKKKKKVRKELQIEYSIACWDPLGF